MKKICVIMGGVLPVGLNAISVREKSSIPILQEMNQ